MAKHYPATVPAYKNLSFSQAGAVQNTWYTALEGTNIEVLAFAVGCTVANETCEVRATVDGVSLASAAGVALTAAGNCYSNLPATVVYTTGAGVFTQGAANAAVTSLDSGIPWLKGASVKVEVRKSTAGGASAVVAKGAYHQY
jgi:hypothetical protein